MSAAVPQADRRSTTRNICDGLAVTLRVRGQWFTRPAIALDFTREGIALLWPSSLAKHRTVFLSLRQGELSVENLVGVVHNCTEHERGYRLGVRFRTDSALQLDSAIVIDHLHGLYDQLSGGLLTCAE